MLPWVINWSFFFSDSAVSQDIGERWALDECRPRVAVPHRTCRRGSLQRRGFGHSVPCTEALWCDGGFRWVTCPSMLDTDFALRVEILRIATEMLVLQCLPCQLFNEKVSSRCINTHRTCFLGSIGVPFLKVAIATVPLRTGKGVRHRQLN